MKWYIKMAIREIENGEGRGIGRWETARPRDTLASIYGMDGADGYAAECVHGWKDQRYSVLTHTNTHTDPLVLLHEQWQQQSGHGTEVEPKISI